MCCLLAYRHGTAWHGMAWHGVAWHGMAICFDVKGVDRCVWGAVADDLYHSRLNLC
jgi:hypothetical protein